MWVCHKKHSNYFTTLKIIQCVKSTFNNEGFFAFYKGIINIFLILYLGMGFPIVSVPIVNAVVFGHYEFWKRVMHVKDGVDFNLT